MKLYSDLPKEERIRLAREYIKTGIKGVPAPSQAKNQIKADADKKGIR